MIRDGSRADLDPLRQLVAGANDAPYDFAPVAEEKVFGDGASGPPRVRVFENDGRIAGVAVSCGKYLRILAVAREYRRRGIGTALLRDSSASIAAAEPGNYFTPGIFARDAGALGFLVANGYVESARTQNLIAENLPESFPEGVHRATNRKAVLEFVEGAFGSIWRFEAARGAAIFYVADAGEIVGFSTHEANNRGIGSFGPAGVSESMRGRGIGKHLLLASLADLRRLGYRRAIIPWTEAVSYYGKCAGARVEHRFVIMRRIAP